jgi:hypothetical protein
MGLRHIAAYGFGSRGNQHLLAVKDPAHATRPVTTGTLQLRGL